MMKPKKNTILALFTACSLLLSVPVTGLPIKAATPGNTYYVATTGSDSNNGLSTSTPFQTIQQAADTAVAGDTVYVMPGTYKESVTIANSGTAGSPITFKNYSSTLPIIDGENLSSSVGALLSISSKNDIHISGFEIENLTTSGSDVVMGISIDGTSTGVQIENCKIHDIHCVYSGKKERDAHGIGVYGTDPTTPLDSLVLEGNEVYDCTLGQSESVVLNGNVTNFQVIGNRVHDNDNIGIDFIGYEGTAGSGDTDRARNGICANNQVWDITSKNNKTYGGDICADGLYVDGGQNIVMERNLVYNSDIGIEAASEHKNKATDSVTIRNNVVYGCKGVAGISFGGSGSTNGVATNIKIYNNTLYDNEPNINIQQANSSTNEVENNICYLGTYVDGTIGNNVVANNLTADPKFVDAANHDFHLQPDSSAIDAGIASTYYGTVDYDGNARVVGSAVDQGAFEYQSGTTTTAPVLTDITSSGITASGATITWTTDQAANSVVQYGTSTSYGSTASDSGYVTSHSVTLTGLSASTTYHFEVESSNAGGQQTVSTDTTFITTASSTPATVDDSSAQVTYSSGWSVYTDSGDLNGSHHETTSSGKYAQFTFTGASIKWISQTDTNYGTASVYIDGTLVSTVDLYSASDLYQQTVYSNSSLASGSHTIKIVCNHTKNSKSSSYYVTVDAFIYS